jgi:hypothetical protein
MVPSSPKGDDSRQPAALYNYRIPGFEFEGVITPPEELFAPWGGLQGWISQQLGQLQANSAAAVAAMAAQDRTATSDVDLLAPIQAMALGAAVPVVFARRRTGGTGGVMVQPRATECRFSNTTNTITVSYHCVLGDGQMGPVQVRDVRNGLSRQGSFSQNYNTRAGTWTPGNRAGVFYAIGEELQTFPFICGGGGDYKGLSTIEFSNSYPVDSQNWKQAWNIFLRSGLIIERGRLVDSVVGPSDNICDLLIWALVKSGRLTEAEIDMDAMLKAAQFIEANQLYCNAEFAETTDLTDFITNILPSFLLRDVTIGGKFAVIPLLPTNPDGTLLTGEVTIDWDLTEEVILPGGYSEQQGEAATRGALEVIATWRQQTSDVHPPLNRTLTIGQAGDDSPAVETMELRGYCTSVRHAAVAAGYRHAVRTLAGGTATVRVAHGDHSGYLRAGQIVRTTLQVATEWEPSGFLSSTWQLDTVALASDGSETLQLRAFPLLPDGSSLLTQRVIAARDGAQDVDLPYPEISARDESGRATDTSSPASSTSGVPFTSGGGIPAIGRPGDVDRVNLPPSQPPIRNGGVAPANGAPVSQAGGAPSTGDRTPRERQRGDQSFFYIPNNRITGNPGPWECRYGAAIIRTRVRGLVLGGGGTNIGPQDSVISSKTEVRTVKIKDEYIFLFNATFAFYSVFYTDLNGAEVLQTLLSSAETTYGADGLLLVQPIDWRCKLKDGTTGPVRSPANEISFSAGGGWSYP